MNQLDLLGALLSHARAAGADSAEAAVTGATSVSVQRRLGRTEHLERSERRGLDLTVYVGKRSASVATTEISAAGFAALAELYRGYRVGCRDSVHDGMTGRSDRIFDGCQ